MPERQGDGRIGRLRFDCLCLFSSARSGTVGGGRNSFFAMNCGTSANLLPTNATAATRTYRSPLSGGQPVAPGADRNLGGKTGDTS